MNNHCTEKYFEAIDRLGDGVLEEMYSLLGSEKISFAALRNMKRKREIQMNSCNKRSVTKIAKENGVSRMTVYRLIRKKRKMKIMPRKKRNKSEKNVTLHILICHR